MQGSSNGPLATFLMLVPLVAVPLLAIFGVPQFSPLAASSSNPEDDRDRDSGLREGTRFADKESDSASAHSGKNSSRAVSSSATTKRGVGSAKEATRRFIPRDDASENDPFLESDGSSDEHLADRKRRDDRAQRKLPPREIPGWVLESSEPQAEPEPSRVDRSSADNRERERGNDRRDERDAAQPRGTVENLHAKGDGRAATNDTRKDFDRALAETDSLASARESAGDDTSRFLDDAPRVSKEKGSSPEKTSDEQPQRAAGDDQLVATLGSAASKTPKDAGPAKNSLSRAKRSVEVATERIERRGPLTWKGAVHRLNQLGIRQYQLQPGQNEGEFHFSCAYTPADTPRISHRFEDEAAEPLRAVEKVLAQIETWMEENEKR